jgi:hypothetical protein
MCDACVQFKVLHYGKGYVTHGTFERAGGACARMHHLRMEAQIACTCEMLVTYSARVLRYISRLSDAFVRQCRIMLFALRRLKAATWDLSKWTAYRS